MPFIFNVDNFSFDFQKFSGIRFVPSAYFIFLNFANEYCSNYFANYTVSKREIPSKDVVWSRKLFYLLAVSGYAVLKEKPKRMIYIVV